MLPRSSSFTCHKYDILVIGGGIIGTAIAKTMKENIKHVSVALLEKEHDIAQHQSSHNSNVIHAGIYYKPNSLKAKLCVEGAELTYEYCQAKRIPYKKSGKLIIARDILETYRLKVLYELGRENCVPGLEILNSWKTIKDIQPNCKGLQALWSPNTGNVDWKMVAKSLATDFRNEGGKLFVNYKAERIKESPEPLYPLHVEVSRNGEVFLAKYAILCLGLNSGSLFDTEKNICYENISFRVNYHHLNPTLNQFIRTNIYAMPHLDLPFLGIHFSPTIQGHVLLGPRAFPALHQEGQINLLSKGLGLLFLKNFCTCFDQAIQCVSVQSHAYELHKYFPMISKYDIFAGPEAIQLQMITNDGEFVDDFLIEKFEGEDIGKRIINCRFVPSPGASSALALANMITKEMSNLF